MPIYDTNVHKNNTVALDLAKYVGAYDINSLTLPKGKKNKIQNISRHLPKISHLKKGQDHT